MEPEEGRPVDDRRGDRGHPPPPPRQERSRIGTGAVAPDLVKRQFTADAPDQLWVADISYLRTWEGFLYLAVVIDACTRRVVG